MAAYKRKDKYGDKWRYRKQVTLPNGRVINVAGTPPLNTKRSAEEAEREHIERIVNPPPPEIDRRKMSAVFDRFLEDYVLTANNKESEKAAKRSNVERYLRPELGKLYLDEVTPEVILDLTAKLHRTEKAIGKEGKIGPKTIKNVLQTLRKCLRWSKEMGWLAEAPTVKMPKIDQEEIRFLSDEELDALLKVVAPEPIWYAAAVLGVDAGLRLGELRALKWTDYNQVTNKLVVTRSLWRRIESSPKSRKPRTVPVTKRLAAALSAIKATKLRGPYVLSREDGEAFGPEWMQETMERLARNAKLTDCGWHTLRHTFCTRLAMRGVPPSTIQKLAGHSNLATTMRYMHVVEGAEDAAIALLDGDPDVARSSHGPEQASKIDTEVGVIIQL